MSGNWGKAELILIKAVLKSSVFKSAVFKSMPALPAEAVISRALKIGRSPIDRA